MPLCTVTLISLHPTTPNPLLTFLSTLRKSNINPLVISRVIRWIILPTQISTSALLAQNIHWDLLLILPSTTTLPEPLQGLTKHQFSITAGVPSRLVQGFHKRNLNLLHPDPESVPKLSGEPKSGGARLAESAQNLELSAELKSWIASFSTHGGVEGHGAVSMLNLLSFKPGMKDSYLKYGAAFAESIGSKRGGDAKIVGTVVAVDGVKTKDGGGDWDEVALAHYPTIRHFEAMLGSTDYQEVNMKYRVPALGDTLILCTSELGIEGLLNGEGKLDMKL
ncbi:hypothetical protein K504DRAFT_457149 [Pleomassaria siparia CBS 279.74]|uniref:Uncharacterized protein n=1 Tax=Pleomassaria siparia CBS 279.74 TaxID=1314801 RepID=A0A6G1KQX7_9PLEO|nr:hypothetical protein K504DRAFT_457149 [Pleomassaria siparia CBS 279.74]